MKPSRLAQSWKAPNSSRVPRGEEGRWEVPPVLPCPRPSRSLPRHRQGEPWRIRRLVVFIFLCKGFIFFIGFKFFKGFKGFIFFIFEVDAVSSQLLLFFIFLGDAIHLFPRHPPGQHTSSDSCSPPYRCCQNLAKARERGKAPAHGIIHKVTLVGSILVKKKSFHVYLKWNCVICYMNYLDTESSAIQCSTVSRVWKMACSQML